jgi:hypothetical protein
MPTSTPSAVDTTDVQSSNDIPTTSTRCQEVQNLQDRNVANARRNAEANGSDTTQTQSKSSDARPAFTFVRTDANGRRTGTEREPFELVPGRQYTRLTMSPSLPAGTPYSKIYEHGNPDSSFYATELEYSANSIQYKGKPLVPYRPVLTEEHRVTWTIGSDGMIDQSSQVELVGQRRKGERALDMLARCLYPSAK